MTPDRQPGPGHTDGPVREHSQAGERLPAVCKLDPAWREYVTHLESLLAAERAKAARLSAWGDQYEQALLAVRTAALASPAGWVLSNAIFEQVRAAIEEPPDAVERDTVAP